MIARITSGYYVNGMVSYNTNKVKEGEAVLLKVNNIFDNSPGGIEKTIKYHNKQNENVAKPNIHISLNFHVDDDLGEDNLMEIADQYMQEMGYGDQPYAVFQHLDASHPHMHIVSSRIKVGGEKVNDSYEYRKSVRVTESIEKEYDLVVAKDQSSNKKLNKIDEQVNKYVETGKGNLLNIIDEVLYQVMEMNPRNEKEFEKYLNYYNVSYYKDPDTNGMTYYTYRENLSDSNELKKERFGKTVNASQTTKKLVYKDWLQFFERNTEQKNKHLSNVRGRIFSVYNNMSKSKKTPLGDFSTQLAKKGIKLNVLRAKTGTRKGEIIGVSFNDFKTGFKYTGEEIKLKWSKLSSSILDDKSDLGAENHPEVISSATDGGLDLMSEIAKILAHEQMTANDYQEDLRLKKRKRKRKL